MAENKPHGFDVQDIRIGGLLMRVAHCKKCLQRYLDGETDSVPELEEMLLDIRGPEANTDATPIYLNHWAQTCSINNV